MKEQTFKITWIDPEDGTERTETKTFTGDNVGSPRDWAQDYAYAKADKGWYKLTEVSSD